MTTTTRTRIALASVAVALSASASALADFEGAVVGDRKAVVSLELKKRDGGRVVTRFKVNDFRITCGEAGDARLGKASLRGSARVSDRGRFKLDGLNQAQSLSMEGELVGKKAAKGTFRFAGIVELGGEGVRCRSGELRWTVKRVDSQSDG